MTKKIVREIVDYTEQWYDWVNHGSKNVVPTIDTDEFFYFIGKSNSFSYEINPKQSDLIITVSDDTNSAYVDLDKNVTHLGANLFQSEFYRKAFGSDLSDYEVSRVALGTLNGAIIHEALHILHTPTNILRRLKSEPLFGKLKRVVPTGLIFNVYNIIEDLYIESRAPRSMARWIQVAEDVLIPASSADIGDKKMTLSLAINLAISFKNPRSRDNASFNSLPYEAFVILQKVINKSVEIRDQERIHYALSFLEILIDRLGSDIEKQNDGEGGSESSGDSSGGDDDDNSERGDMQTAGKAKKILESMDDVDQDDIEKMARALIESSDAIENGENVYVVERGLKATWETPICVDMMDDFLKGCFSESPAIKPESNIDYGFTRDLIASRSVNRVPGQARTRGPVLVSQRLTRVATDNKVFSKRDSELRRSRRMEVIILADFSGSTCGDTINLEVGAVMSISETLTKANIPNAIYFHTSIKGVGHDDPLVVHVASHDMLETTRTRVVRMKKLPHYMNLAQNYDGVAIEVVSKLFTSKTSSKYIIVLSDGQPDNSGSYSGSAGTQHTINVVNKVRKSGTNVFSISVVKSVVRDNNNIYGKEYNIDASNSDVDKQFRKLVSRIAQI